MYLNFFFLIFTFMILIGCATSPEQMNVSEAEINTESVNAYAQIKSKAHLSRNVEWNQLVQRVAQRIAQASGHNYQWESILIDSPEVNAWCMPGGKIAVYTGIMPILKTEGALAAVLGHEVAHATLKHGLQKFARAKQENYIGLIVAGASVIGGQFLCKTNNCRLLTSLGGVAGGFAITYFEYKFSREEETEADQQGQLYMVRAGYDPRESLKLWERMSSAKGNSAPPEFLSTHPSDEHRRENLNKWLPQAMAEYQHTTQKYGTGEVIR